MREKPIVIPYPFPGFPKEKTTDGQPCRYIPTGHTNDLYVGNSAAGDFDFRSFPPQVCTGLRLRILGWPKGIRPGVISFVVFGKRL